MIQYWVNTKVETADPRLPPPLRTIWTGQSVFNSEEANEAAIEARKDHIMATEGLKPAPAASKAKSALWVELTQEEKAAYEAKAKRWIEKGPNKEDLIR